MGLLPTSCRGALSLKRTTVEVLECRLLVEGAKPRLVFVLEKEAKNVRAATTFIVESYKNDVTKETLVWQCLIFCCRPLCHNTRSAMVSQNIHIADAERISGFIGESF